MDDMDRTPHSADPAEGTPGAAEPDAHRTPHSEEPAEGAGGAGDHTGAPEDNPEHNTAPDGQDGEEESTPLGGHETTADELSADNAVEEDTLKTLDPDNSPA